MIAYTVSCTDTKINYTTRYFIAKVNGGFQIQTLDKEPVSCVLRKCDLMEVLNGMYDKVECHRL